MSKMNVTSVKNSALWAAYGDALGFITELTDSYGVKRRAQSALVSHSVPWQRLVGGKFGATVDLPAGCYSDDTQLRLATGRAIRGEGYFDVEAFAKVELTVWLNYSLGGGLATKAAASQLVSPDVAWFTNFFESKSSNYFRAGGNGACMRIQPHVWASSGHELTPKALQDVIRNTICTHGHMRAIAGAVFHAELLSYCLVNGELPGPETWLDIVGTLNRVSAAIEGDRELSNFWLPFWESRTRFTLDEAIREVIQECAHDIRVLLPLLDLPPAEAYERALDSTGGRDRETRGSGTKTSILSLVLAWLFRMERPEIALLAAANTLGSDTDTIATLAGALLGTMSSGEISDEIQDRMYISDEAARLFKISTGQSVASFEYPEVMSWRPPRVSLDAVSVRDGKVSISGLGPAEPISQLWHARRHDGNGWQWFRLQFGQTVLAKRRSVLDSEEKPTPDFVNKSEKVSQEDNSASQPELFTRQIKERQPAPGGISPNGSVAAKERSLDELSAEAIHSGFKEELIGKHIMDLAERESGIELAVAYVAIIAKARIARTRASARRQLPGA